jgi:hypothetical protein
VSPVGNEAGGDLDIVSTPSKGRRYLMLSLKILAVVAVLTTLRII